jgi:tetratricopeptide (TPR) repeat protein
VDERVAGRPIARVPWWAAAIVIAAGAVAWIGAGALARRTLAARIPLVPDVTRLPAGVAEAIRAADAAARDSPGAATIGDLGRTYHASQDGASALAAYALAESLAGDDEWIWTYHKSLVLEERGAPGTRAALEQVLARNPDVGHAWYRLGELHLKQGRLDDADAAYARAVAAPGATPFAPPGAGARQVSPVSAYASLARARASLERGRPAEARTRLQGLVESYPAFGPARALLRQLGSASPPAQGRPTPATYDAPFVPPADPVLDAIVATSRHSDVLLKYAGQATRAGDPVWREFLVRRALAVNPDDRNVVMEMAAMLQAAGRPAEALEYLVKHETLAPGDHHTLVQQGRVLSDLGRLSEAEAVLRRAVAVRDTTAEFNLGTVLDRLDRWDEARVHYGRALAIDPFNASAMNNLAIGLDRRGQASAALPLFESAIAIEPANAGFYTNYASALIGMRRFDAAIEALAVSIALDPRAPNAHNNLGIALARQARLADASQAFERALQLDPSHLNARRNLEQTRAILGR